MIYTVAGSHDFAIAISGIVPILILTAVAAPSSDASQSPGRAMAEMVLGVASCTVAFFAEVLALTGVLQGGLGMRDTWILGGFVALVAIFTFQRMLSAKVTAFASARHRPEERLWQLLTVVVIVVLLVTFGAGVFVERV